MRRVNNACKEGNIGARGHLKNVPILIDLTFSTCDHISPGETEKVLK